MSRRLRAWLVILLAEAGVSPVPVPRDHRRVADLAIVVGVLTLLAAVAWAFRTRRNGAASAGGTASAG